jgi:ParB family chromosome partitioning protein
VTQPASRPTTLAIADIQIGDRMRQDLGDIEALGRNIARLGLLMPIAVTPDGRLLAGLRRLRACQGLGWRTVPVVVVDPVTAIEKEAPRA